MDADNTWTQHAITGIFSISLILIFRFLLNTTTSQAFSRVSVILLFLVLIIGPISKLRGPEKCSTILMMPGCWRGEVGIWFALTGLIHFIIVGISRGFLELIKIGGSGFGLTNLLGLLALIWALILTITSFRKVIVFLGAESWRWINSFTYVIFYLIFAHLIYFQFFSTYGEIGPDWFGYLAVAMAIIVLVLQATAFIKVILNSRTKSNSCAIHGHMS
jgi:methionine sulfoxide reductase heme-binding subunit